MNNTDKSLFAFGRLLVGGFFLLSGFNHFRSLDSMAAYAASASVPMPNLAVIVSGVLLVVAGLSLLLGAWPVVGIVATVLFFVPVTMMMHSFWGIEDAAARQAEMSNFLKNFALMGAALMFFAIPRPWPLSVEPDIRERRWINYNEVPGGHHA